jgi:superkiller protein 3
MMSARIWRAVFLAAVLAAPGLPARAGDKSNQAEADIAHNTGRNYLADGRAELAVEHFKKAIDLDSKNYFAYKGLGIAYAQLKNFKEAEKAQRKCIDINPDFADARNDLGATLIFLGRREDARKEWLSAFASPFNPSPDQTAWNLATSYAEDGNQAEAARWFETAVQRNKSYAPAHVGLASTLIAQSKVDEAISHLDAALKVLPDDLTLALSLGDAYFRAGRFREARTQLEGVVQKDPVGATGKQAAEMLKHFPK